MELIGALLTQTSKIKNIHLPPPPPPQKNSLYLSKWNFPTLRLKHLVRFSHKNAFLIFPEMELWTFRFRHNLEKIKKTHPEKKFLVFLEIETSCSNIKNFLIYQETETLIFFLYSKKMKLSSSNIKKCLIFSQATAVLIFRKTETLKNYLYFRKWNFLIFQERYIQYPCITELFCISGKVYSQHWHDRAFLYFNKVVFRALAYIEQGTYNRTLVELEPEAYLEHCQNIYDGTFCKY